MPNILWVDSQKKLNEEIASYVQRRLRRKNIKLNFEWAETAEECIQKLSEESLTNNIYDLIIMDLRLAVPDDWYDNLSSFIFKNEIFDKRLMGLYLFRYLRESEEKVGQYLPVIIASMMLNMTTIEAINKTRPNPIEVIGKPIDPDELVKIILDVLDKKEIERYISQKLIEL